MPLPGASRDRRWMIRQIALIVDQLDRSSADALLERLPESHERAVRDEMIALDTVDENERDQVTREFHLQLTRELDGELALAPTPPPQTSPCETLESLRESSEPANDLPQSDEDPMIAGRIGELADAQSATVPPTISRSPGQASSAKSFLTAVEASGAVDAGRFPPNGGNEEPAPSKDQTPGETTTIDQPGLAHSSAATVHDASADTSAGRQTSDSGLDLTHPALQDAPSPDYQDPAEVRPAEGTHPLVVEHVPKELLPLRQVIESYRLSSLYRIMRDEQPQMVALVMAAMLPDEAAQFVANWPPSEQGEILRRIARMRASDAATVQEVCDELLQQLDNLANEVARGEIGRERVQAIVAAAQGTVKQELLGGLADADRELFRQIAAVADAPSRSNDSAREFDPHLAAVAFDRLVDLSNAGLQKVFSELDSEVSVLALAGASQPCLADVLERLPEQKSRDLRERMERMGPLRLSDIQQAQLMAVAASHHLLSSDKKENQSIGHLKLSA